MNFKEIENMLKCLDVRIKKYTKGETIIHAGEKISDICILLNGLAHIVQEDYWGKKIILSEVNVSGVFAEVFSTLGIKSEVNVLAIEDSEIMFLDIGNLITICSHTCNYHNKLLQNLLKSIAEKNLKMTQKMTHIGKRSIREKLLSYLSSQSIKHGSSKFNIPFNRQDLADYLCVDRSALSSEISKLKKEGIIDSRKNEFEIIKKIDT